MAPEFTGAKEPDELPEVDTASDAYPVLEERKKDRKKERMSVHVHLRSLLFSRNEMSSRKSVTRERRELNIGDPIGYPRRTRSFTSDFSARDYYSRTSRPRIPLLVFSSSVFIVPARRKVVFQTQRRNARRRGRMRTRGAQRAVRKQRRQMFSTHRFLDFFLAIARSASFTRGGK